VEYETKAFNEWDDYAPAPLFSHDIKQYVFLRIEKRVITQKSLKQGTGKICTCTSSSGWSLRDIFHQLTVW